MKKHNIPMVILGVIITCLGAMATVDAQFPVDITTQLSKFLVDLRAGTLGVANPISTITATGRITSTGASDGLTVSGTGDVTWSARTNLTAPAAGVFLLANGQNATGLRMQFGNIPAIGSGFGTSPAMVAGSSDSAFSVNVGTGGAATSGVVNFASTWAVAPMCIGQDQTTVGAGVQKVTATTSAATITTAVAWTASDIVTVHCFGPKS